MYRFSLTRKTDETHCIFLLWGQGFDASNVIGFCPVPNFIMTISRTQTHDFASAYLKKQTGRVIPWHCSFTKGPSMRKFTLISANLNLHQSPLQLPLPEAFFSSTLQVGVQILPFQKQLQFCRTHIII